MLDCDRVPLFPLQAVLFPGTSIPLHIFEPRYREMIEECVKTNCPFGVVLIRNGSEVDDGSGQPEISRVGCLARVVRTEELDDGRYFVEATGSKRFSLKKTSNTRSFLTGSVTPLDEQSSDPEKLDALCARVREQFRLYIVRLLERLNRTVSTIHLPDDPTALSFAVAGAMDVPLLDKQRLLEAPSTEVRLDMEHSMLCVQNESGPHIQRPAEDEMTEEAARVQAAKIKRLTANAVRSLLSRN